MLLAHIAGSLEPASRWTGRQVVVTAGPTREPVDPVRFLGNRSSGRMGYAIAGAAWRRGAAVTLITGPSEVPVPGELTDVRRVETAEEMCGELHAATEGADALFMVAAVADFRPRSPRANKIRRREGMSHIEVEPVPDLLAGIGGNGCIKVAFAVEFGKAGVDSARSKLEAKKAQMIVLNDPGEPGAGFEVDTNKVTIIDASGGTEELPLASKREVADMIMDRAERLLPGG